MRDAIADAIGVAILAIAIASIVGCVEQRVKQNLQPFIAVTGNYGLLEAAVGPTPAPPAPADVCGTCKGTGKVLERPDLPQSKVYVTCAACGGTGKATTRGQQCTSGTCRSVMRTTVR
jgi:hypothetical protein